MRKRKEGGPSSSHHILGLGLCSKAGLTKEAPFLVRLLVSTHWRLSTKEGQRGILDTIYEKVRSSFFPAAIRFALKTEKGRSSYLCNYGLCWPLFRSSTLFSLSFVQFRLTKQDWLLTNPRRVVRLDQVRRMNLYLCTEVAGRRPLNCSSAMQWWLV